jgi:uncharacterized protein DUF3226
MLFRLLVEGSDDKHLIKNLLRDHAIELDEKLEILDCHGVQSLLEESLPTHLLGSYDAIGIIVDADLDLDGRWQSIRDRLLQLGYGPPAQPPPEGLILATRKPAVGVWLMPDNVLPGMLEDFAQQLIPAGDELWPIARSSVAALPVPRRFTAERKAEIHTYLAWQEEPGTPLGLAVTKKYFQTDVSLAQRFVDWVRRLTNVSF